MKNRIIYSYSIATILAMFAVISTPNSYAYDLPENTLKWEVIPSAIRADGSDSFVIEVYAPQAVSSIKLSKMPSSFNDGDYVKPTNGYFYSSIALKDDGVGGDRLAGDKIYTAGPFIYDTSKTFPAEGYEGADGIFNDAVGDLQVTFTDSQYTYGSGGIFVRAGLVRTDIEDVETVELSDSIQTSQYMINIVDNNDSSERHLRRMPDNYASVFDLTKSLYSVLPDSFDQLLIFSSNTLNDVSQSPQTGIKGMHYITMNDIDGIGFNRWDFSGDYGSNGILKGVNYFASGRLEKSLITHEITHQWEAHLKTPIQGLELTYGGHWSPFVSWYPDSEWKQNLDGTYTKLCHTDEDFKNPIDKKLLKYLMGYSYYTDINETLMRLDWDAEGDFSCDKVITKPIHEFTMDDLIAVNDIRTPGPELAQRDFNIGVIFPTNNRKFNATEMTFATLYAENLAIAVGESLFDSNWSAALPAFPDTVPPVITLSGDAQINVIFGSTYIETGATATDNVDGTITSQIVISGNVNTDELGVYEITYNVSDSSGNNAIEVIRTVNVIEEPVCEEFITINSEHETAGRAYSVTETTGETCYGTFCWGGTETTTWYAQGSDDNLGTSGSTTSTLYESSAGVFTEGVCPGPDLTAPVITILGDNPQSVLQGSDFTDAGATAEDNIDGNITANINVAGSIDTNVIGSYELTYNVIDAAGNEAIAVRTVNVIAVPACQDYTDTISNHESGSRAYSVTETTGQTCYGTFCFGGTTTTTWFAQGSDENLGTSGTATVTLKTNPAGTGFVTGECPSEPQAPVITNAVIDTRASAVDIRLTVTDIDGDLVSTSLEDGTSCIRNPNFPESFLCSKQGLEAGHYIYQASATDAAGLVSESFTLEFDIVIGGPAPVIDDYTFEVIDGAVYVNGTASDADGNIRSVSIDFGPGWSHCDGTTTFDCFIPASMFGPGETHTFALKVDDTGGNHNTYNDIATYTFDDVASCFTDTNYNHVEAGRAYVGGLSNLYAYATGSDTDLGLYGSTYYSVATSLEETSAGVWAKVTSCP